MKKLMRIFTIAMAIGLCSMLTSSAPINTSEVEPNPSEAYITDDGIVCTVRDPETGDVIGRCFLCNCAKLAEQVVKMK